MVKVSQNAPSFIMFFEIYQTEKKVIFTLTEPFASEYLTVTLTVHLQIITTLTNSDLLGRFCSL